MQRTATSWFVGFTHTRDAEQEAAAFYKRTGRWIKLLTVQEILDEEHVQRMKRPSFSLRSSHG